MPKHFVCCDFWCTPDVVDQIRKRRDDSGIAPYIDALESAAEKILDETPPVFDGSRPKNRRAVFAYMGRPSKLVLAYLLTGDERFADKAVWFVRRLFEIYNFHSRSDSGLTWFGRWSVEPIQETIVNQSLIPAVQWLDSLDLLDSELADLTAATISRTGAAAMSSVGEWAHVDPGCNHFLVDATNIGYTGVFTRHHSHGRAMARFACELVDQYMRSHFREDGSQVEGAPHYHQLTVLNLFLFADVMREHGVRNFYDDDAFCGVLDRALDWIEALLTPNGCVFSTNDSGTAVEPAIFEAAAARLNRPGPLTMLRQRHSASDPVDDRFLEWSLAYAVQAPSEFDTGDKLPLVARRDMELKPSGIVVLRDPEREGCLFAKVNPTRQGHNHPDKGAFELYAFGQRIVLDHGSPDYQRVEQSFTRTTTGHSTIARVVERVEDYKAQDIVYQDLPLMHEDHPLFGGEVALTQSDAKTAVTELEGDLNDGAILRRRITLMREVGAYLFQDQIIGRTNPEDQWDWLLHGVGDLSIHDRGFKFTDQDTSLVGAILDDAPVELLIGRGPALISLEDPATGRPSGETRPAQSHEQSCFLMARRCGATPRFCVILAPQRARQPVTWQPDGDAIIVQRGGACQRFRYTDDVFMPA